MKNTMKFLGFIALVAVMGFTMAACPGDDDGKDDGKEDETGETYFTVTLDFDGGYMLTGSVKVTSGSLRVKSGDNAGGFLSTFNPQKDNYTFGGWFTQRNGAGTQFTNETKVTSNLTVYAKWTSTGGGGKSIVITGIPNGLFPNAPSRSDYDAIFYLYSNALAGVATGTGTVSNNTLTIPLLAYPNLTPYTGSGSFILLLGLGVGSESEGTESSTYIYTNGQSLSTLGVSSMADFGKLPKYNISSTQSTIAFNLFQEDTDGLLK
jgi:uncharacterized repeat protein (TIGR02543 family)